MNIVDNHQERIVKVHVIRNYKTITILIRNSWFGGRNWLLFVASLSGSDCYCLFM